MLNLNFTNTRPGAECQWMETIDEGLITVNHRVIGQVMENQSLS